MADPATMEAIATSDIATPGAPDEDDAAVLATIIATFVTISSSNFFLQYHYPRSNKKDLPVRPQ